MLVILATWGAEIRRIAVQDQPGQIIHEIEISKKLTITQWTRYMAQVPPLQS
jgi:hypothetical protein